MKTPFLFLLLLAACGAPAQYTVLQANANSPTGGTQQASSWPSLSNWEAQKTAPKDVAVIVAIEDYAFLPDVTGAVQNANDWEQYFRVNRGMENVFVLANQDAPIEEIQRFVDQAVSATQSGGSLWFVFIGHGAAKTDGSDGVLIGMDAQQTIESLTARSLSKGDVVEALNKGKQANTVMVLDTCFSGRSPNGDLLAQGTQPVIPVSTSPTMKSGFALLSAAKGDQVAGELPGGSRPAFSYLLLGALRGWGDSNGDKTVTATEAVNYAQKQLRLVKGRQQTPEIVGEGDLILTAAGSEADPGVAALMSNGGSVAVAAEPDKGNMTQVGDRIDTGQGIIVPVMPQYAMPDRSFPGYAFHTQRMTEATMIAIVRQKMSQMMAAGSIANMTSEPPMDAKWLDTPTETEVGKYSGTMMTFEENTPLGVRYGARYLTYQIDALWVFEMETTSRELLEKRTSELLKFIETSEFK